MPLYVPHASHRLTPFTLTLNDPNPSLTVTGAVHPLAAFEMEVSAGAVAALTLALSRLGGGGGASVSVLPRRDGHRLQWELGGNVIEHLARQGGPHGVRCTAAAALNGPGGGQLELSRDGTLLRWRAPGSVVFGAGVDPSAGGTFWLRDGLDPDRWVKCVAAAAWMADRTDAGPIVLRDAYNGLMRDVTAAEAAAGVTVKRTLTLRNLSAGYALANLTVWLESSTAAGWELSWDDVTYYTPTTELAALAGLGAQTVSASGTKTLYARRTVAAGAAADPRAMIVLRAAFDDGLGGRAYSAARGLYRIFNAAGYRAYRNNSGEPIPGVDAVFASSATLPWSPATAFADGTWRMGLEAFNGVLGSDFAAVRPLKVTTGQLDENSPGEPETVELRQTAGGVPHVTAVYNRLRDEQLGFAGDQWALWYTTNGSAPGGGSPQYTQDMTFDQGHDRLEYDLPAQTAGTNVRVLVKVRRSGVVGIGGAIPSSAVGATADAVVSLTGPAAPAGGGSGEGRPR